MTETIRRKASFDLRSGRASCLSQKRCYVSVLLLPVRPSGPSTLQSNSYSLTVLTQCPQPDPRLLHASPLDRRQLTLAFSTSVRLCKSAASSSSWPLYLVRLPVHRPRRCICSVCMLPMFGRNSVPRSGASRLSPHPVLRAAAASGLRPPVRDRSSLPGGAVQTCSLLSQSCAALVGRYAASPPLLRRSPASRAAAPHDHCTAARGWQTCCRRALSGDTPPPPPPGAGVGRPPVQGGQCGPGPCRRPERRQQLPELGAARTGAGRGVL